MAMVIVTVIVIVKRYCIAVTVACSAQAWLCVHIPND